MESTRNRNDASPREQWLFRQGELVLGPIATSALVEKLYAGEVDARTEVARPESGNFRRLADVESFKVHLAKAEAKQRVDAQERTISKQRKRTRNIKFGIVTGVVLMVAVGAAWTARYLSVHGLFKDNVDIYAGISVSAPDIRKAKKHQGDDELVDYPFGGDARAKAKGAAVAHRGGKTKMSDEADDPDGMQTANYDQEGIKSVISAKQKTLFPCIAAEAQRQPGLNASVPIEFVVGNDGKVMKVWVDNPKFKDGPLSECLLRELQKWPFKPYNGSSATVGLSFKIGKGD
jgi:hypothetical protein